MPTPEDFLKANKATVVRFNREVIEQGNEDTFRALVAPDFVNRTAAPGMSTGPDGLLFTFLRVLRPAFPDLKVEIHDQVAEGDKVMTRKTLRGTQRGELLGIAATDEAVAIDVIDVIRLENGRYAEHWSVSSLGSVLAALRGKPPAPATSSPAREAPP